LGNVDSLVIARGAGTIPLGTYTLASNVSAWPLGLLEPIQMNVGLPLLSRARSSMQVFNRTIGLCMALLASTYFFGSAMISALAGPIVAALYGPQWAGAAPMLAVLAGVGFLRGFLSFMGVVVIASNATVYQFWLHVIWIAALTPCMIAGVYLWGAQGAAIANLVVDLFIMVPVAVVLARRASGMAVRPLVRATVYPVLCSAAAAVVAHVVSTYVPGSWGSLVLGGLAGCALYAVLVQAWFRRTYAEARELVSGAPEPEPEPDAA
jgi:lipopolysaccharide exporter